MRFGLKSNNSLWVFISSHSTRHSVCGIDGNRLTMSRHTRVVSSGIFSIIKWCTNTVELCR